MRYKTVVRLALRVMGVYFLAAGLIHAASRYYSFADLLRGKLTPYQIAEVASAGIRLAIGVYLMTGAKWLVNWMIPANRPYCHECGYQLTGGPAVGVCPECGTAYHLTDGMFDSVHRSPNDKGRA